MTDAVSIREFDSPADRIRAHRQADDRGIVLVEGPADRRLLARVSPGRWAVFLCGTRNNVKDVLSKARKLTVERIVGLVDRDFDDYYESECSSDPLIFTFDTADLEAHLFQGPWFEDVLAEFGSEAKITALGGASRVREILTHPARCLGVLRRANALCGWGLDFDEVAFIRKVDARSLRLDILALTAGVRSRLAPEHRHNFVEVCEGVGSPSADALYRGKDALEVLAKGLVRAIGTTRGIERVGLEAALRLSADERLFETEPFCDIATALER